MDPITALGTAAAITQFAGQLAKITISIIEFCKALKDAPEAVRRLMVHVQQLNRITNLITKNPALQKKSIESCLLACSKTSSRIEAELNKVDVRAGDGRTERFTKKVLAVLKDGKFESILKDLEREKSLLMLCIQEIDSQILHTIGLGVTAIRDDIGLGVTTIRDDVAGVDVKVSTIVNQIQALSLSLETAAVTPRTRPLSMGPGQKYFKVPNRHTRKFFGRVAIIHKVEKVLCASTCKGPSIAVVRGMGGQGKTQLAMQICLRKKHDPFSAIFWIDATSEASAQSGFDAIFEILKVPGTALADPQVRRECVIQELSETSERWLLVFDNYDDVDDYRLADFFPQGEAGAMLITSRNATTKELIVDDAGVFIDLPGLEPHEASELLCWVSQTAHFDSTTASITKEITDRLGNHPLAITQAASYIKIHQIGLRDFLDHYKSHRLEILSTITPAFSEYRRKLAESEKETVLSVFTTWQLSFQKLVETAGIGNVEAKLLTVFAFFDNQDIPELLFRYYDSPPFHDNTKALLSWLDRFKRAEQWDSSKFWAVCAQLADVSLVQSMGRDEDGACHLTLHPLVQDWIKLRAASVESCPANAILAWLLLGCALPGKWSNDGYHGGRSLGLKAALSKHILVLMQNHHEYLPVSLALSNDILNLDLCNVLTRCGLFMRDIGHYHDAQVLFEHVVRYMKQRYGTSHGHTLIAMRTLVEALRHTKNFGSAKYLVEDLRQAVKALRVAKGSNDKDTLETTICLIDCLVGVSRPLEAEELCRDVLKRADTLPEIDHGCTLACCDSLAHMLEERGELGEARELFQRIWCGFADLVGPEHTNALVGLMNLAGVVTKQGRLGEALDMYNQALPSLMKTLGPDHPHTVTCSRGRCMVLNRLKEALEKFEIGLTWALENHGPDHPLSISLKKKRANVLRKLEKMKQREDVF